ncbi:putative DNA-binding domain-containing protein [Acuticoccus sp.]|uniref:HvfC/BufC family peptide modification chaperone n=1 Tax=Acuticoccus sp. TaxID=1904378 RepID=UPI003B519CEF
MPWPPPFPAVPPEARADHAAAFAAALSQPGARVGGLTDGRGAPAPDRFQVWRNNVVHSLAEALGATFPATRRLMGEADFRGAAVAYAQAVKPRSPLLFLYGDAFPAFLTAPGRLQAHVGEVAAIDYARVQAYHAADAAPLEPAALAALGPDELGATVFVPHPATRLLQAPCGGATAWRTGVPGDRPETAVVTRPHAEVQVRVLGGADGAFASALVAGRPLGEVATLAADVASTLAALLSAGAFTALER